MHATTPAITRLIFSIILNVAAAFFPFKKKKYHSKHRARCLFEKLSYCCSCLMAFHASIIVIYICFNIFTNSKLKKE